MNKLNILIFLFFVLINSLVAENGLNLCGDWTQYKDSKCFKVVMKKGTEEETLKSCSEMDKSSALITIHSKEEQEFLNKLLSKYNNISNNVWIGMKYKEKSFQWMDGTDSGFTNWAEDAVINGGQPCVEMSLVNSTLGKWRDESCIRKALIVCQKKPDLSLSSMKDIIENLNKQVQELKSESVKYQAKNQELELSIDKQRNESTKENQELKNNIDKLNQNFTKTINSLKPMLENMTREFKAENQELKNMIVKQNQSLTMQTNSLKTENQELKNTIEKQKGSLTMQANSMIPLGFLYTQLLKQSSPQQLWPNFSWDDVSEKYSMICHLSGGKVCLIWKRIQ